MNSEFRPKNIMISHFWAKNYRIAEWCVLSVSEFDGKKLFHLVDASRRVLIFTYYCFLVLIITDY